MWYMNLIKSSKLWRINKNSLILILNLILNLNLNLNLNLSPWNTNPTLSLKSNKKWLRTAVIRTAVTRR